jgi:CheY-like chemotaxis protein
MEEGRSCVRIEVSDNGRGIPYRDQERVFDPFFTTREVGEGVGLGLSVAHGITRSHGGDINLDSIPGQGTTVTLVFPCLPADPNEEEEGEARGRAHREGEARVMVVDDEAAITRLVDQSLSKKGYSVTQHLDPEEALTYFRAHSGEVDLMVVDLSMPGMRGDELGTAIREVRPGFPILVMTGFGGFLDLAAFVRQGPTSILPKPFTGEALLQAVEGVLRDATRSGAPAD